MDEIVPKTLDRYIIIYHIRHFTLCDDLWHFILYMIYDIILSLSDIGRLGIRLRKVQDMSWLRSQWSPGAQGQSGRWVFLNEFFLTDFSEERKTTRLQAKSYSMFVEWFFWAYPKKPFQADPFWSVFLACFIEYHRYEFMISLLEVMQKKSPPWHEEMQLKHGQLWRLLRHGGYIVTETQAGKKKNAALTCQSKKFRTWNHM